jgi:hypothetical protein
LPALGLKNFGDSYAILNGYRYGKFIIWWLVEPLIFPINRLLTPFVFYAFVGVSRLPADFYNPRNAREHQQTT